MHTLTRLSLAAALLAPAAPVTPAVPASAADTLKVIATIPTYGELAREIGGDLVEIVVLCRPGQDLHSVTATPSLMGRVRDADLLLYTGLDAELWLDPMLRGSGNTGLLGDPERSVSLSDGIVLTEVPTQLSRREGDIHAFGNTHVWTDPLAVRRMAEGVRDALVTARPEAAAEITARHDAFRERLTRALVRWLTDYKALKGRKIVTYHRSWPYFLDRFGIERVGTIEPKPRVTPTAAHLEKLVETMQTRDVTLVLREPFHHPDAADFVADATGATVLELSTHPGFPEGSGGIIEHFEYNLAELARAWGLEVSVEVPADR